MTVSQQASNNDDVYYCDPGAIEVRQTTLIGTSSSLTPVLDDDYIYRDVLFRSPGAQLRTPQQPSQQSMQPSLVSTSQQRMPYITASAS